MLKLPTIVLVVIVTAVNAWMNWRLWHERVTPPAATAAPALVEEQPGVKSRAPGQRTIFRPRRIVVTARPPWSELESDDYHVYAGNLQRVDCPEKTVRDIIVADIAHTLAEQLRTLHDDSRDSFWQTIDERNELARQRLRREWELRLQKWSLLRELFKYPVDEEVLRVVRDDGMMSGVINLMFSFLDREDFIRAFGATRYYTRQLEAIEAVTEGILLPSDYDRARQIRDQLEASLQTLLGKANLEEVLLRATAAEIHDELPNAERGFVVSGTELRQLVQIQMAARDPLARIVANAGFVDLAPDDVAATEVETAIARFLGADRYADYLRAKDERYHDIHRFVADNGLTKMDAEAVFDARVKAEDELRKIHEDKELTAQENVLLQAAVKARVEAVVKRVFGPVIAAEYLGDGVSGWIRELVTAPPEEPTKTPEAAQ